MPHALNVPWTFWYINERSVNYSKAADYSNNVKSFATVTTLEDFCLLYQHLKRPNHLPGFTLCAFRDGIHPTWEDPCHIGGGRLSLKFKKGFANHVWEGILFNLIGSQSPILNEYATGVALNGASQQDALKIWISNRATMDAIAGMKKEIADLWELDESCIDYTPFE